MCWTVVVTCGFGCVGCCSSPCAVLVVGDASREPGGGAEKGKVV